GTQRAQEAVRDTHAQLAELMRHEHASLALAQRCSAVTAPTPLFSALLNYRHSSLAAQSNAAQQAAMGIRILQAHGRSNYPCALSVDNFETGFSLTAQVRASIGARIVCEYMERALSNLVDALETQSEATVRSLDVMPDAERQRIARWNVVPGASERSSWIQDVFEMQVQAAPDAIALVAEDLAVSYAALNERANQL